MPFDRVIRVPPSSRRKPGTEAVTPWSGQADFPRVTPSGKREAPDAWTPVFAGTTASEEASPLTKKAPSPEEKA